MIISTQPSDASQLSLPEIAEKHLEVGHRKLKAILLTRGMGCDLQGPSVSKSLEAQE